MKKMLFSIAPLSNDMRADLEPHFDIHHTRDMDNVEAWLGVHGAGIEYVITDGHFGLAENYMEKLPDIKLISSNGVGYDAINTNEAVRRNILVTHTPNVLNAEVATTALMLLIGVYRDIRANIAHAHSGNWETNGGAPLSRTVDGRTIGIVGLGRIGHEIAAKLAPFNPTILYHTRTPKDCAYKYFDNLQDMAQASDVLICITPGGASTYHLISDDVMNALGPDGVLINVARGSVVDEQALINALKEGRLGGAGLDVFEAEPHIPQVLREMPNVLLTPHVGSATVETRAAMGKLAVDNLLSHLNDGTVLSLIPECLPIVAKEP